MTQMKGLRNGMLIAGMIIFFVYGSHLLTFAMQPDDIWWTPRELMLSLDESRDRVEVFVGDEMLRSLVADGKIFLATDDGMTALGQNDIGFRLNNWDRVRAGRIWDVALNSAIAAVGFALLVGGLVLVFMIPRKEKEQAELPSAITDQPSS